MTKISGHNKITGEIVDIKKGEVACQVTIKAGENTIVSVITTDSANDMALKVGDKVVALIKATEVMVMK